MTTEIRSASASGNGSYAIESATTSSFVFYSDINKNGNVERVRYFLGTSTIYKGITQPNGTPATYPTSSEIVLDIIDNIVTSTASTSLFRYYDSSYTGTQSSMASPIDISKIRLIGITFSADIKPSQAPGAEFFSTLVDIRNLRDN
jgi:hypothetical protein